MMPKPPISSCCTHILTPTLMKAKNYPSFVMEITFQKVFNWTGHQDFLRSFSDLAAHPSICGINNKQRVRIKTWQLVQNYVLIQKLQMNQIWAYLLIIGLMWSGLAIQIQLFNPETCFDYVVENADSTKIFYFNYNHNIDNVNMVLYLKNIKQVWEETGSGIDYKNVLEVFYKESGNYTLCFLKKSDSVADISFEIVDQDNLGTYVGKEQLAKLSRRISEFLMDIKRVGWTFKQVLEQHNSRKQTIRDLQSGYGYLLALKTLVMVAVVGIQILIVKRLFK